MYLILQFYKHVVCVWVREHDNCKIQQATGLKYGVWALY